MLGHQCGLSVSSSLLPNKTQKYLQLCTCVGQCGSDAEDEAGTQSSAAFFAGCDSVVAACSYAGSDLDDLKTD